MKKTEIDETSGRKEKNKNRPKDEHYQERVQHFYVGAAIATVIYLFFTTLEFVFTDKIIPQFVTEGYLAVVGNYAINNARFKYEHPEAECSSGEMFVYVFWAYFFIVAGLTYILPTVKVTFDLFEAMTGITAMFCLSTYYNIRHGFRNNNNKIE